MDLIRPEVLWALLLAPVLWWLARPPVPRRRFETAHLPQWRAALAKLRRDPVRFRRLRFWLLLAAFIAVVLAGTEPRAGGVRGPGILAILLDGSTSTTAREPDGRTAFERATQRIGEVLPTVPAGVEVRLLIPGKGPAEVVRGSPDDVLAALPGVRPLSATGRAPDLAAIAAELSAPEVAVWTLTDGRGSARLPGHGAREQVGAADLYNRAVRIVAVDDRWPLPEVAIELEVRTFPAQDEFPGVEHRGAGSHDPLVVRPQGEGTWRVSLRLERGRGGAVTFSLPADPSDALGADDVAGVVLPAPPAPRVGVLRHEPADGADWIGRAAALLADLVQGRVVDARPGERVGVLLVDGGSLSEPPPRSLTFGTSFGQAPERQGVPVVAWDREHPLTADLDLSELVVRRALGAGALPAGRALVQGVDGALVVAVETPARRSVHLAFRLEDSNLPLLAAFPQLLRRAYVWGEAERAEARIEPAADPAESDLRQGASGGEQGLPGFGSEGDGLAVPFLLFALLLLGIRTLAR